MLVSFDSVQINFEKGNQKSTHSLTLLNDQTSCVKKLQDNFLRLVGFLDKNPYFLSFYDVL